MNHHDARLLHATRRQFFAQCGVGIGSMALASLLGDGRARAAVTNRAVDPLAPRPGHFAPRAKSVIYLFMAGGPSQLELYDYKPQLQKLDGQPIPEFELMSYFILLIVAGNETTRNAITGGLRALMDNPGEWAKLQADPDGMARTAAEEIVRWTSPVIQFCRTTTTDVELGGKRIPGRFGLNPVEQLQVLTPMNRGPLGTDSLNTMLRGLLNPEGPTVTRGGHSLRVGDKVMQVRNNYDLEVFNGDIGRVYSVAFSSNSKILAAVGAGGTILFWDVAYLMDVVPRLCALAGRSLTRAEWAQYVPPGTAYAVTSRSSVAKVSAALPCHEIASR